MRPETRAFFFFGFTVFLPGTGVEESSTAAAAVVEGGAATTEVDGGRGGVPGSGG